MIVGPQAASGQNPAPRPIIYAGARVRVTLTDPPEWIYGTVDRPGSRNLTLFASTETEGTRIVLGDGARLQLYAGRRARTRLGAGIGALIGAVLTGALFSDDFGNEGTAFAVSQAAFAGAAVGAGLGAITAAAFFAEREWTEVPVQHGRIVFPPLAPDSTTVGGPLSSRSRWTRFDPRPEAFAAFFGEYDFRLHDIEGIFVREDGVRRVAIVRDRTYRGYDYVLVNLEPPSVLIDDAVGDIVGAARRTGPGRYELAVVGGVGRARVRGDRLITETRGRMQRWTRVRAERPRVRPR